MSTKRPTLYLSHSLNSSEFERNLYTPIRKSNIPEFFDLSFQYERPHLPLMQLEQALRSNPDNYALVMEISGRNKIRDELFLLANSWGIYTIKMKDLRIPSEINEGKNVDFSFKTPEELVEGIKERLFDNFLNLNEAGKR